jgi:hypothetical protein
LAFALTDGYDIAVIGMRGNTGGAPFINIIPIIA